MSEKRKFEGVVVALESTFEVLNEERATTIVRQFERLLPGARCVVLGPDTKLKAVSGKSEQTAHIRRLSVEDLVKADRKRGGE